MNCPKCGGEVKVLDNINNTEDNEIYRKRKCKKCGNVFYTVEFEADEDESLRQILVKYRRANILNRKRRDAELEKRRIN